MQLHNNCGSDLWPLLACLWYFLCRQAAWMYDPLCELLSTSETTMSQPMLLLLACDAAGTCSRCDSIPASYFCQLDHEPRGDAETLTPFCSTVCVPILKKQQCSHQFVCSYFTRSSVGASNLAASEMLSKEGPISAAMSGSLSMVPKRFTPRRNRLASRRLQAAGHSCPSSSSCRDVMQV